MQRQSLPVTGNNILDTLGFGANRAIDRALSGAFDSAAVACVAEGGGGGYGAYGGVAFEGEGANFGGVGGGVLFGGGELELAGAAVLDVIVEGDKIGGGDFGGGLWGGGGACGCRRV